MVAESKVERLHLDPDTRLLTHHSDCLWAVRSEAHSPSGLLLRLVHHSHPHTSLRLDPTLVIIFGICALRLIHVLLHT